MRRKGLGNGRQVDLRRAGGCRDEHGNFDIDKLVAVVESAPVKAIEIKLSQGAKPGLGGHLPCAKVTAEIARIRGVEDGKDVVSSSRHTAFTTVAEMLDFVEMIAERTDLPVGIKSAVGEREFWDELAELMADGTRGVDFITIDGGEGGTGAAPMVFSNSVAFPFRIGFAEVYKVFAAKGLADKVVWIGSGKLGLPENALVAFAMGADMVAIAREAMLASGLEPEGKAERLARYVQTLRRDLLKVSETAGVAHPGLLGPRNVEIIDGTRGHKPLAEVYGYQDGWGAPNQQIADEITHLMEHFGEDDTSEEQVVQHEELDSDEQSA